MNRYAYCLLALCAGAPLLAQAPALTLASGNSSITLYGVLDAGVARVSHTLDFDEYHPVAVNPTVTKKGDDSATGVFNGGISQTRVGLKGGLDLGNGWKGVFTLESAIDLNSGNLSNAAEALAMNKAAAGAQFSADSAVSGQLFNRGAFIGLSSDTYGTLTVGRHTSFMLDLIPGYDALQGAQLFTPIGFSGVYGGGGATDASRVDNSLKYKVQLGEVTLGGLYKFGGVAGVSSAKGATEFIATWEHGNFGIAAAYQHVTDATAVGNPADTTINTTVNVPVTAANPKGTAVISQVSQPIGTIALTCEDTKATMIAARYKLGRFAFFAGYQYLQYTNPSNPTTDLAITSLFGFPVGTTITVSSTTGAPTGSAPAINVTPFTVNGSNMTKDLKVSWIGAKVDVTQKLNLAVSYYNVGQNDFSNGLASATADLAGHTSYASALLDYNTTKNLDAYVGYMTVKGTGGMVAGYTFDSNSTLGVGLRYKF